MTAQILSRTPVYLPPADGWARLAIAGILCPQTAKSDSTRAVNRLAIARQPEDAG